MTKPSQNGRSFMDERAGPHLRLTPMASSDCRSSTSVGLPGQDVDSRGRGNKWHAEMSTWELGKTMLLYQNIQNEALGCFFQVVQAPVFSRI